MNGIERFKEVAGDDWKCKSEWQTYSDTDIFPPEMCFDSTTRQGEHVTCVWDTEIKGLPVQLDTCARTFPLEFTSTLDQGPYDECLYFSDVRVIFEGTPDVTKSCDSDNKIVDCAPTRAGCTVECAVHGSHTLPAPGCTLPHMLEIRGSATLMEVSGAPGATPLFELRAPTLPDGISSVTITAPKRHFWVKEGATLRLHDLRLTGGRVYSGEWLHIESNGGSVVVDGLSTRFEARNTLFAGCRETGDAPCAFHGGALYVVHDAVAIIIDSTFRGNAAHKSAGAIMASGVYKSVPTVNITNTSFEENRAILYNGGAIYLSKGAQGNLLGGNNVFAGNRANETTGHGHSIFEREHEAHMITHSRLYFDRCPSGTAWAGDTTEKSLDQLYWIDHDFIGCPLSECSAGMRSIISSGNPNNNVVDDDECFFYFTVTFYANHAHNLTRSP